MGHSLRFPRVSRFGVALLLMLGAEALPQSAGAQATYAPPSSIEETGEVRPEPLPPALVTTERGGDEPKLVHKANGTYTYKGQGFDATIERDGSVRMRDSFIRSGPQFVPRRATNGQWFISFWETRFDFLAWLEKKFGNDLYRSERRWFLEGTRDLREKLAIDHAMRTSHTQVHALWSKPGLSFAERKRLTFAMWDESTEDDYGQVGRTAVEEFVRAECPEGSGRGFTPEELASFNEKRKSKAPFAPYTLPRDH
jgi:hypothetical protein